MVSTLSLLACARTEVTLDRVATLVGQAPSESLTLEYKEKFSPQLVKSVAAMGNTYGGLIIVGVTDRPQDDRLVGAVAGTVEQIVNSCFERLEPPFEPEIIELALPGGTGRSVVVIRVHPDRAPRPLLVEGRAPVRLHGRNAVADRARLRQLFDESPAPRQVDGWIPPPNLSQVGTDDPRPAVLLRSGLRVPVGEAVTWRALSERSTAALARALDAAPLTRAAAAWCAELGLPAPHGFRLIGHNRARRLRLVASARDGRHLVQAVAELQLPPTYGSANPDLLLTLDLSACLLPEPPAPAPDDLTAIDLLAPADPHPRGALRLLPEEWSLRLEVRRLADLLDAVLATLVDQEVTTALAAVADIDPVMAPWPRTVALRSASDVRRLIDDVSLAPIPGAGTSHGADLVTDPGLDLREPDRRDEQIAHWLEQIALDAGLSGMQRLLERLSTDGS